MSYTSQTTDKPESSKASMVQIPAERAGQRLDNFLLGTLKGVPKSLIYKIVRSGQVRINGGRVKVDYRLNEGDMVRVPPVRMVPADVEGTTALPSAKLMALINDSICFEDDALLAINKPTGIASHGGSGVSFGVIEILRALRPEQSFELVHRLDRDTSGVMVIAKKRSALRELQALLRDEHATHVKKRYLTLLLGRMPNGIMTVDAPLQVDARRNGERHVLVSPRGKPSLSHFKLLERRSGHSYCEVLIETGRTHQIRVHAESIKHPIAGDDKYGDSQANKKLRQDVGLKRLFLHAASLEFSLNEGKTPYMINAPLANDLNDVLNKL